VPFFEICYGTGEISGQLISDHVQLGQMVIPNQVFGVVSEEKGDAFVGVPFAGILGLGSRKLSVAESKTIFENMWERGLIKEYVFSVYMSLDDDNNGEVLFGRIDTNYMASNF
jgi:saccharopepsin